MDYRKIDFKDKSFDNEDYRETVRGKCWDLKDAGLRYTEMAKGSNVGVQAIKNFSACRPMKMRKENWVKFSSYIDRIWLNTFGSEENRL